MPKLNPTSIGDSAFIEIAARAAVAILDTVPAHDPVARAWFRAACNWGMDIPRAGYLGREMSCWNLLNTGCSSEEAEKISGVETFTVEHQVGLMFVEGA